MTCVLQIIEIFISATQGMIVFKGDGVKCALPVLRMDCLDHSSFD